MNPRCFLGGSQTDPLQKLPGNPKTPSLPSQPLQRSSRLPSGVTSQGHSPAQHPKPSRGVAQHLSFVPGCMGGREPGRRMPRRLYLAPRSPASHETPPPRSRCSIVPPSPAACRLGPRTAPSHRPPQDTRCSGVLGVPSSPRARQATPRPSSAFA